MVFRRNARKAVSETGCICLKARNISTGETFKFTSIGECARFFKVSYGRVREYIDRGKREVAFIGAHLLVREDEEFPSLEDARHWVVDVWRLQVVLFNKTTKTAKIFESPKVAASSINMKLSTLAKRIKRSKELSTYVIDVGEYMMAPINHLFDSLIYVFDGNWESESFHSRMTSIGVKPKVRITHRDTGNLREFENIYEMARHFGYRHEVIMKKQKSNNGMFQGYLIEMLRPS